MMKALYKEEGASLRIGLLEDPAVTGFIDEHAAILDGSFAKVEMSEVMRSRLRESDWIFSGMKTFHELNEAFPSLLDEDGTRKPFERFLSDVQSIDETYNRHYLRAEYNYAEASAEMAGKWERFQEDGDEYNLQYRTAGDDKVRPEHAALHGVTLPPSDSFWDEYYPPNGWNCRCTVVQVLKDKYPATDRAEALRRGQEALEKDTKGMFRFNSGKQGKTFPDYNPYTLSKCTTCTRKLNLAKALPENEVCAWCLAERKIMKQEPIGQERKYSLEERKAIYAMPLEDQFVDVFNDGRAVVRKHLIRSSSSEDYNRVLDVAISFARMDQATIYLLPEINHEEKAFRRLLGLSENDGYTPDIMRKIGSFVDVKSPKAERKLSKNAGKADTQHAEACITNHRLSLDESRLDLYANRIFKNDNYQSDVVYFWISGTLSKKTKAKP